jgi:hypothetical protein
VRPFFRAVSRCVALLLAAMPAASLACEWECASQSGARTESSPAHPHASHLPSAHHHHHPPAAATGDSPASSVRPLDQPCDHSLATLAPMPSASPRVMAPPPPADLSAGTAAPTITGVTAAARPVIHGPPGADVRPLLTLRI